MVTGKLMRLLLAWGAMVASQVASEKTNEETLSEEKNTDRDTSGMVGLWPRMSNKPGSRWIRLLHESKTKEDGNTVESTVEHESKWDNLDTDENSESTIVKWGKYKDLKEDLDKDGYTNQKKAHNNMQEDPKKHLNTFETDRDRDDGKDGHIYPDSTWKDKQYVPQSKANKANEKSESVEQKTNRNGNKRTLKNSVKYEEKRGSKLFRSKLKDWLKLKSEKENKQKEVGGSMQLTKGHKTELNEEQHQLKRKWHRPDKNDGKHGEKTQGLAHHNGKHESNHHNGKHEYKHHNGEHGSKHHNGEHGSKHHNGEHGSKHHNGEHGSKHHNGGHEYVDPLFKLKIQHKKRWPSAIRLR